MNITDKTYPSANIQLFEYAFPKEMAVHSDEWASFLEWAGGRVDEWMLDQKYTYLGSSPHLEEARDAEDIAEAQFHQAMHLDFEYMMNHQTICRECGHGSMYAVVESGHPLEVADGLAKIDATTELSLDNITRYVCDRCGHASRNQPLVVDVQDSSSWEEPA
ncbi:MAG: hypothetical protein ABEN55_21090 [Bradymonadaceae bacterium]